MCNTGLKDIKRSNRVNMSSSVHKVALIAFDGISAFHLSVPCLVFQDIFVYRKALFELEMYSVSGDRIRSSSGFDIELAQNPEAIAQADIVIIPSWPDTLPEPPETLITAIKQAYQRGALLAGLCLGAFVLAKTGLLDGKTATTHWAFLESFSQRFPNVHFDSGPLFIDHGQLITSAGTAASLDCCLHIVRQLHGSDVASQIARMMVTAPFRAGGQQQYIPTPIPERPEQASSLSVVIEQISLHPELAYSIDEVAERCAMSRRTFTRQFKATYGCTFGEWLLNQRLKFSQQLLENTSYPVSQIAGMAGFGSESVYRKHFKKAFHVSPSRWRDSFSSGAE